MSNFFLDYKSFSAICIIGKMTNTSVSFKHSKYCKHQPISSNLDAKNTYTLTTQIHVDTHTYTQTISYMITCLSVALTNSPGTMSLIVKR